MLKTKQLARYFYYHHFVRYLFVGGSTFILDIALLLILHDKHHVSVPIATATSYIVAFIYNFTLNRWWTFSAAENNTLRKHVVPYALLFTFNLVFTTVFVSTVSKLLHSVAAAKTIAVIIQTTWNYLIYKYVIFVKPAQTSTSEGTTATTSKV